MSDPEKISYATPHAEASRQSGRDQVVAWLGLIIYGLLTAWMTITSIGLLVWGRTELALNCLALILLFGWRAKVAATSLPKK